MTDNKDTVEDTVFELLVGLGVPGSLAGAAEDRIIEVARRLPRHLDFCGGGEFCSLDDCMCGCHGPSPI